MSSMWGFKNKSALKVGFSAFDRNSFTGVPLNLASRLAPEELPGWSAALASCQAMPSPPEIDEADVLARTCRTL